MGTEEGQRTRGHLQGHGFCCFFLPLLNTIFRA